MIQNFSDHAANERTFLAWIRTAIAIMAFGFVLERFDLFLRITAQSLVAKNVHFGTGGLGNVTGFALILLGTAMMVIAAGRFLATARNIDKKEFVPGTGGRVDVALASLLALLGP